MFPWRVPAELCHILWHLLKYLSKGSLSDKIERKKNYDPPKFTQFFSCYQVRVIVNLAGEREIPAEQIW